MKVITQCRGSSGSAGLVCESRLEREKTMAGYSGTPLQKKLGIKPGARVCFVNAPPGYAELLEPLPENVSVVCEESLALDLVHGFVASRAQLIDLINLY